MAEQGLKRNSRRLRNRSRTSEPSQQQLGFSGSRVKRGAARIKSNRRSLQRGL
jgi:hypothetical protein